MVPLKADTTAAQARTRSQKFQLASTLAQQKAKDALVKMCRRSSMRLRINLQRRMSLLLEGCLAHLDAAAMKVMP